MTKNELIKNIAKKKKLNKAFCDEVIDAFIDEVKDCLLKGDKLLIKGFMNLEVNERPERKGRNPKTGEVVTFPAVKTIKCKFSETIKDAMNGK